MIGAMFASLLDYIQKQGIGARLIASTSPTPTVPLAAAALGVPEEKIVKTVVFEGKKVAGHVALVIISGEARVDRARVAAALNLPTLKLASPATVLRTTGFEVGGVPPVGHLTAVPAVVDRRVMEHDLVFGGGGDEDHMLEITPGDIVRLTGAIVADVTLEGDGGPDSRLSS
jgi:prolyl-tRNA editing enzyme YbaK/EbsC (Cys-tRNA(Pro) deacylase)